MEKWLTITDYSQYRNVSISTVRRYIKRKQVKFKLENGRYFLLANNYEEENSSDDLKLILKISAMEKELRRYKEEVSELKMLVDLYERGLSIGEDNVNNSNGIDKENKKREVEKLSLELSCQH